MRWSTPRRALLFALVALGACDTGAIVDAWPDFHVRGTVTDPAGRPVGAAVVWLETFDGAACDRSAAFTGPYVTDARGRYAGEFSNGLGTFSGCVAARVTPPASSGLAGVIERAEGVVLDVEEPRGAELRLDVRLPSAGPL